MTCKQQQKYLNYKFLEYITMKETNNELRNEKIVLHSIFLLVYFSLSFCAEKPYN